MPRASARPLLFGHPFSSYTWKTMIALDESGIACDFRSLEEPENGAELARHWPRGSFPLLLDGEQAVWEASIIAEYGQAMLGGRPLIPTDPKTALDVRFLDRIFDHHVMAPMQAIVSEHLPFITKTPDEGRITRARMQLDQVYGWLEERAGHGWACGEAFTLADCAAAPALFYADWVHPFAGRFPRLHAYRARLLARPSVARAVEAARPYRSYFPLGAPDRD